MSPRHRLTATILALALPLTLLHCSSSDDPTPGGTSGTSGDGTSGSSGTTQTGGNAGASASGGSSGEGGVGGQGGDAGQSGSAGAPGGTGGSGGAAGSSGVAGSSAGAGASSVGGTAGSAGIAGAAGTSGAAGNAGSAGTMSYPPSTANVGWIGGACTTTADCMYEGAICLTDGFPNGTCSLACDDVCPDRNEATDTVTFCVDGRPFGLEHGACVSKCDTDVLAENGCAGGYMCVDRHRYGDPYTVAEACVPAHEYPCGPDEMIEIDYPDKGALWIPSEARCGGTFDLVVMLHGINPDSNPTPSLRGGRRLDLITRALIDGGNIVPVVLAEPVHFEASSTYLYGPGYDLTTHLDLIRTQLESRGITVGSLSYTGHSGAGCDPNNGLYKVLDELDTLVPAYAPSLKLWGMEDICYEPTYHWTAPTDVLGASDTRVINVYSVQGDPAGYESHMFPDDTSFACDDTTYTHCLKSPEHPWCSSRTIGVAHNNNPYYFLREVFPQVFPGPHGLPPCWE